jgi:hypothetical protein
MFIILGVCAKPAMRFGWPCSMFFWLCPVFSGAFGGICKVTAMVGAKKRIVFTGGRLGFCFEVKKSDGTLKKTESLPKVSENGRDKLVKIMAPCHF